MLEAVLNDGVNVKDPGRCPCACVCGVWAVMAAVVVCDGFNVKKLGMGPAVPNDGVNVKRVGVAVALNDGVNVQACGPSCVWVSGATVRKAAVWEYGLGSCSNGCAYSGHANAWLHRWSRVERCRELLRRTVCFVGPGDTFKPYLSTSQKFEPLGLVPISCGASASAQANTVQNVGVCDISLWAL